MPVSALWLRSPTKLARKLLLLKTLVAVLPGYAWIFPLGGGLYNVGCGRFRDPAGRAGGANLAHLLERFLDTVPAPPPVTVENAGVTIAEASSSPPTETDGPSVDDGPAIDDGRGPDDGPTGPDDTADDDRHPWDQILVRIDGEEPDEQ